MYNHVCPIKETLQHRLALRAQQVKRNRPLAAVEIGKVGGHTASTRTGPPNLVTPKGFDFHDISTLITEDHCGHGTGHVLGEVDYSEA
jgi:hypothetical protein